MTSVITGSAKRFSGDMRGCGPSLRTSRVPRSWRAVTEVVMTSGEAILVFAYLYVASIGHSHGQRLPIPVWGVWMRTWEYALF